MADQTPAQSSSEHAAWHESALQSGLAAFVSAPGASMTDGIDAAVRAYLTNLSARGQLDARSILQHYVEANNGR